MNKSDEIIFNLLILNYFFPLMEPDKYFYNQFVKGDNLLFERQRECFPLNEYCDDCDQVYVWTYNYIKD